MPESTAALPARNLRLLTSAIDRFVNDIHSQLNRTRVRSILQPVSLAALQEIVRRARAQGHAISVAGGRHAMGGQQFGAGSMLLDMSRMNRVLRNCYPQLPEFLRLKRKYARAETFQSDWYRHYRMMLAEAI